MGVVMGVLWCGAIEEDTGRGEGSAANGGVAAVGAPGATARWTGGVVPGPVADEVVTTGGRGAPGVPERRAGCAEGAAGRTASAGPDEVGAPSPGRRAVALRCTGWAGALGSGLVAGATGFWADRCAVGAAGASWRGAGAPGTSAERFVARWTGGVGPAASEARWDDGECAGPEGGEADAAWRWTGGSAPVGVPGRSGAPAPGVAEGRSADRAGVPSPPGAGGGVTRATAR
ncbi:hypothetical protein ABZY14_39885 [Streptomyces sp. NPDC006617]|uniref:hypothetical protein n=1 Tax=Streptomyces sp. NPDC006617 TaxID=3155354 RepID=UPI0033BF543C